METVPDGLTDGQRDLLRRLTRHLESDSRIEAAWLVGSLARGLGDRFSDVDIQAAVAEPVLAAVVAEWPGRAASLVDLAFARPVVSASTGTTFTHVTSGCLRFDVTFITTSRALRSVRGAIPLLATSSTATAPGEPDDPPGPSADRVRKLSEEFLRGLGLLPVVIGRREYLVAGSGATLLRSMLLPVAKRAYADLGLTWPQTFEDAVRNHLHRELGVAL